MEQPVQKSGMPRGCLIALIIAGILIVLMAALVGVCYFNKDKFMKWSVRTGVAYAQEELSKNPVGIDTVKFNALANGFMQQLETAEISDEQFAKLGPVFQQVIADKKIDTDDVHKLSDAMVTLFPALESLRMTPPGDMNILPDDTGGPLEGESPDSGTVE